MSFHTPIVLVALLATGCAESSLLPSAPAALFGDATGRARYEALRVAVGDTLAYADHAQRAADADSRANVDGAACTALEDAGDAAALVTYAAGGGCTSAAGATYTGTLEVAPALDDGATAVYFDGFSVDDGQISVALDGSWSQTDTASGEYERTAHLRTDVAGRVSQVHGTWEIRDDGDHDRVVCADGFQGAIEGLGGFEVACEVLDYGDAGLPTAGWVELHADDTMQIDLEPNADGCLPVSIDNVYQGPLCLPEDSRGFYTGAER